MTILNDSARPATRRGVLLPAVSFIAMTFTVAAARPVPPTEPVAPPPVRTEPVVTAVIAPPRATPVTSSLVKLPAVPQARENDCDWDRGDSRDSRSFNGTMSMSDRDGGTRITQQIGTRGRDRVIQTSFGDLRICAVAIDAPENRTDDPPSKWSSGARRVTIETDQRGDVRTMEIVRGDLTFNVNGRRRDVDASALAWRDALFALLDDTWDLSQLRGQVSTLRGEISTVRGERSTLLGEISTLRGEVSTMRGEISTARGEESTLRGEISTIRGHESSLRGEISSERGAISSLEATRRYEDGAERSRIDERIRRHEDRIAEIERDIRAYDADGRVREVERRMSRLDTDGRVAAIERRIRDFDLDRKVADVNRRLERLDVDGRVRSIERDIDKLDYDRRSRQMEARIDDSLSRLRNVLRR